MIDVMRQYADYRPSGDDWLGAIPAHWLSTSLGAISTRKSFRNRPDLPLLSVLREKGVVLRSSLSQDENYNFIPDDLSNYQVASEGDLVVNKMKAWQGSLGIAPQDGIVSPAYYIFDLAEIKKRYAHRLLRSRLYADFFGRASDGVRIGQWDLGIPAMKRIPVVIPPPDEQDAIARYLDEMDRRIARFIRNRRRLIEVLNEQRRSIIRALATRGTRTGVEMQGTALDQFPILPTHWEESRVKREFTNLDHKRIPLNTTARGEMATREYDYYGASGVIDRVEDYIFDDELLLLAEDGANLVLRNLPLAIIARGKFWVNNHAHILKPKRGNIEYFAHVLELVDYRSWVTGAAQPKLTRDRLMRVGIPAPPVDEQDEIVSAINSETGTLTEGIAKTKREIELIREYRARLIADVVTGKVDVRHLASSPGSEDLEEAADELEPLDDAAGELEDEPLAAEVVHADD